MSRMLVEEDYVYPCIEVKQSFGPFYACAIKARDLLKLCEPIRAIAMDDQQVIHDGINIGISKTTGTQRAAHSTRPKQIAEYIKSGSASFPNSIIIGANISNNGFLEYEGSRKWYFNDGKIFIKKGALTSAVIDGQHRLKGFEMLEDNAPELDDELLCSIYLDIPMTYHAQIFSTINSTQRRVNKNLIYQLYQIDMDEKNHEVWSPEVLSVYLSRALASDPKSPLNNKLSLAIATKDELPQGEWKASFSVVVEGVLRYFSSDPKGDRNLFFNRSTKIDDALRVYLKPDDSPLRRLYLEEKDKKIYLFILNYLTKFYDTFCRSEDCAFRSSIGVDAVLSAGVDVLGFLSQQEFELNLDLALDSIKFDSLPKDKTSANRTVLKNIIIYSFCNITGKSFNFNNRVNVDNLKQYLK